MKRLPQWQAALEAFTRQPVEFAWGSSDCCLTAANAIQAMTGVDIASDFRGQYTTQLGAFKTIATLTGGKTVEDAVAWCARKHEMAEWPYPRYAQRGDLALVSNGDALLAGVVAMDGRRVISIGEGGLVCILITAVRRAWKV